jgi:hypothetical protein
LRLGEHQGDAPDEREVEELQIYLGNMMIWSVCMRILKHRD